MSETNNMPAPARAGRRWPAWCTGLLIGSATALNLFAQSADSGHLTDIDRTIAFVEGSASGTDLFNEQRYGEALDAFEELLSNYEDLDENGYVALSMIDCLIALERTNQAREALVSLQEKHPELNQQIRNRLMELSLAGRITETVIDVLRDAVEASEGHQRVMARFRLARALEKRAADLLSEAADIFREATSHDDPDALLSGAMFNKHGALLQELAEDARALVEHAEWRWGMLTKALRLDPCGDAAEPSRPVTIDRHDSKTVLHTEGDVRVEIHINIGHNSEEIEVRVDGECIVLDASAKLLIRRHQERIGAIVLETTGRNLTASPVIVDPDPGPSKPYTRP